MARSLHQRRRPRNFARTARRPSLAPAIGVIDKPFRHAVFALNPANDGAVLSGLNLGFQKVTIAATETPSLRLWRHRVASPPRVSVYGAMLSWRKLRKRLEAEA